jgi:antitoxin MazE
MGPVLTGPPPMSMRKKWAAVGNSFGIVIDKPILEILDIDRDTELEVTTDGHRLIIEPVGNRKDRVSKSHQKVMKKHDSTFRKLAK